jgi:hypothetical protein
MPCIGGVSPEAFERASKLGIAVSVEPGAVHYEFSLRVRVELAAAKVLMPGQ